MGESRAAERQERPGVNRRHDRAVWTWQDVRIQDHRPSELEGRFETSTSLLHVFGVHSRWKRRVRDANNLPCSAVVNDKLRNALFVFKQKTLFVYIFTKFEALPDFLEGMLFHHVHHS